MPYVWKPYHDFGLAVTAEPNETGDSQAIPIQTASLMRRWGRDDDAEQFDALARQAGLIVVFEAICNVWEFAVASHLPNADALRDELARLQQHADLTRRPDAS